MRIIWSPLAISRVEEISDYIAYDSPIAANNWIDKIWIKAGDLKDNPEIGRVVPELKKKAIREIIFGNYRIIYELKKGSIWIHTIRNFKQILPMEDFD
jgi:plasmid stabilization system protein ParE